MEDWNEFYKWLKENGYDIVREYHIFRFNKYITSFDPMEDGDSGEIEETIARIKENDQFIWDKR